MRGNFIQTGDRGKEVGREQSQYFTGGGRTGLLSGRPGKEPEDHETDIDFIALWGIGASRAGPG